MKPISRVNLGGEYMVELNRVLGKGATGCVYFGKDLKNDFTVAVKIIKLETIDNEVTEYLLKMEKCALMLLNSPFVLKGLKNWQNQTDCYIVTEYCNGRTLKEYIKQNQKLSFQRSIQIVKGILQGYQNLVQNGVVHRDMKPANIMLHNNMPKIIDFGYCQIFGHKKPSLEYNVGSPSYMAPQSFKFNIYNEKTQIWAIGVIFYECLTGRTIDEGRQMKEIFREIQNHGVPYPGFVNSRSRKLIDWCLNPNPKLRPTCSEILKSMCGLEKENIKIERKINIKMNKLSINYQPIKMESGWKNGQMAKGARKQKVSPIYFGNGRNFCLSQHDGKQKTDRIRLVKQKYKLSKGEVGCTNKFMEMRKSERQYQLTERNKKIISISPF